MIAEADRDDLPALLGELARLDALARLRLNDATNGSAPPQRDEPDIQPEEKLIDVHEAAEILGVTERWLYDNGDRLPFVRKLGRGTTRYSLAGIRRYIASR